MPGLKSILEPSDSRQPYYDGPDLDQLYTWSCPACHSDVHVGLGSIQKAAWSWPQELPASLASEIRSHFRIGPERAHGGGWISLLICACPECGSRFVLYAGVDEYANSVYRIHIQGLARVGA